MKSIVLLIVCFAFVSTLYSQEAKILEPNDFKQLIKEKEDVLIVDIRKQEDYLLSRIKDAFSAFDKASMDSLLLDVPKTKPLFLYCKKGERTIVAGDWLVSKGFLNVYLLKGGFELWLQSGFEIDKSKKSK